MAYTVYVLKSISKNRRYIGHTDNVARRLQQHNSGNVTSSKAYKPYKIIHTEIYNTEKEAIDREKFLKTHKGFNELKKLLGD